MAKIPSNLSKFESPFKILEDFDLNYQTPTSSMRVQKKLLFNSSSSEKHDKKVTFWHERFVCNKHPLQITTMGLKTPPMDELSLIQPLAPMKPRKLINKTELKPKKLIFNDIEELEVDIIKYPATFNIKHDENINIEQQQCKRKIQRKKQTATDEKENHRELLYRIKSNESNKNKVDCFLNIEGSNNKNNNHSTALSLPQSQNSHTKGGLKHFRI